IRLKQHRPVSLETNEECSQMTDLSRSTRILASGFAMGESARWHNDRFWLSDWGAQDGSAFYHSPIQPQPVESTCLGLGDVVELRYGSRLQHRGSLTVAAIPMQQDIEQGCVIRQ